MAAAGRVYVDSPEPGSFCFDGGFVETQQIEMPCGMLRRVKSLGGTWTEAYRWDPKGLLIEVDGVEVGYDGEGRVVSCRGKEGSWDYTYSGAQLSVISTPRELRRIVRDDTGRPLAYSQDGSTTHLSYDNVGRRSSRRSLPTTWHRDEWGRLWTIRDSNGRVFLTYLWEGRHCIAAIAGSAGAPLSAVYSVDPTGTPVRVIARDCVHRIPRDAFGEGLLKLPGTPALFGGAALDGMVYLPYRRLDPITGSFDAPDPFDGEQEDPRRASGWAGPLRIELPAAGPYTVCRNNPVSLADPTGAISDLWWAIPSALTWSMQNTIASLLGLWLNLDLSPLGLIMALPQGRRPFDLQWVSATNYDMFALRSESMVADIVSQPTRAFTYQFYMGLHGLPLRTLDDARLFIPDNAFRPSLYGSLLLFKLANAGAFVTKGQRPTPNSTNLTDWSRCGGAAEPAFPGSKAPVFPSGGIHFNSIQAGVTQQPCTVTEILPGAVTLFGALSTTSVLQVPGTGLGLHINDSILLTDSAGVVEIVHVLNVHEAGSTSTVTVDSSGARLTTPPITLNGLGGQIGSEPLTPVAGSQTLLSVVGSSNDYHPGSTVVRLSRGVTAVHFARISGLEASLTLNSPLPASLGNNLSVRPATAPSNFNGKIQSATSLLIVTGPIPGQGTWVAIGPPGSVIPAGVVGPPSGGVVTLDTDISSLGPVNTAVNWSPVAPSASVGTRSGAPEADLRPTPS